MPRIRRLLLCYILLLHQTTTLSDVNIDAGSCVISYFYIKPQLKRWRQRMRRRCVISYFYIKPQLLGCVFFYLIRCVISYFYIKPQLKRNSFAYHHVVLYLTSTSNHNALGISRHTLRVVLYLTSTSNHNRKFVGNPALLVVLYLTSTSNHNGDKSKL